MISWDQNPHLIALCFSAIYTAPATWAFILPQTPWFGIFAHALPCVCNIPSQIINAVGSSSTLISHRSITSSNGPSLSTQSKTTLSGTSLFLLCISICLYHQNVSSRSAGHLPSCCLYIAVLVPKGLFTHTWTSHSIRDKERIFQRRALGMLRRLQATFHEEGTGVCLFSNPAGD